MEQINGLNDAEWKGATKYSCLENVVTGSVTLTFSSPLTSHHKTGLMAPLVFRIPSSIKLHNTVQSAVLSLDTLVFRGVLPQTAYYSFWHNLLVLSSGSVRVCDY